MQSEAAYLFRNTECTIGENWESELFVHVQWLIKKISSVAVKKNLITNYRDDNSISLLLSMMILFAADGISADRLVIALTTLTQPILQRSREYRLQQIILSGFQNEQFL